MSNIYHCYKLTELHFFMNLHSLDFNSCTDYLERGINTTGYYYMYVNGGSTLESVYCKFDVLHFETCYDYYNANNQSESGRYLVYLNARPYEVYCDFSNGRVLIFICIFFKIHTSTYLGQGVTRFDHDKMNEEVITNCENENCFNLEITYAESLDLVDLIKERSSNCEQKLEVPKHLSCKKKPIIQFPPNNVCLFYSSIVFSLN